MRWVGDHSDRGFNVARPAGPDMTDPIMQRLGFVRIHGNELRSMKRRRFVGRIMVLAGFVGVVSMGVYAHGLSSRARTVSDRSIPSALNEIPQSRSAMSETLRQAILLWSPPEGAADEFAPSVKPASRSIEQKSTVPWSDLF